MQFRFWPFGAAGTTAPPAETRASVSGSVTQASADAEILRLFGLSVIGDGEIAVTIESALGVPAVWAGVNFLAATVAGLPLKVFRRTDKGPEVYKRHPLTNILGGVANIEDLQSSFDLRKWMMEQVLTGGRGLVFIERNAIGKILNLWPLDPTRVTIRRVDRRKVYEVRDGRPVVTYQASEVLDIPYMLTADGFTHRSPILTNRDVIGLAQAVTAYGKRFFLNGGVPPFAITGNFQSGAAMGRAAEDLDAAVRKSTKDARQALVLPQGLTIQPIGTDAEKAQMIEAQRFLIEQIARIFSLPPVFLQDLTNGTYSNTEQQDLHLVKHTIRRWVEQVEQEMTLKFFGRGSALYVEHVLDGLLRGDFKTRLEGIARAIQTSQMTPNEGRALENRPAMKGGDQLLIQGATVPLAPPQQVEQVPETAATDPDNPSGDEESTDDL